MAGEEAACRSLYLSNHCLVGAVLVVWAEVLVSACAVLMHHVLSELQYYHPMATSTFAVFWEHALAR